ncbi:uncharacterized protein LOC120211293 [Hibiscus syriacus]|uniref:uncharacterized protein LOC120211293 n=1 Tax=Hibiscus syriacus TaxID=106335 RepID=UPI001921F3F4|nr:uncharacterized protein LOC120211293 [Hibiscus syriacus]
MAALEKSNDGIVRRQLWHHLKDVNSSICHYSWIIGGDFNTFLHSHESSDHDYLGHYLTSYMNDFQDHTQELELLDHPFFGLIFTWSNKQTYLFLARKLDRVPINSYWATSFPLSFLEFLAPGISDHCMAIVNLAKESPINRLKPFKFFNFWYAHPCFLNVVRNSWLPNALGNPMNFLFTKLKRLKVALKEFNNENFKNLPTQVKVKRAELELQQLHTLKGEDGIEKEIFIQDELKTLEEAETLFLKQKAKIQLIKNCDKNTKFFHSILFFKNKRDTIHVLIDEDDNSLESFDAMAKEVTTSFSNWLGSVDNRVKNIDHSSLKELLNYYLPSEAASALVMDITNKEIQDAFFSQGNEKAPGPDGYSPCFFKKAWSIVGEDVLAAVKYFFHNNYMNLGFNSTIIALVPKVPNPRVVKDFRPILCCSIFYKAITKILVKRLSEFLADIISLNQTAFIKGRSIVDNTLLAQELVKGYSRKSISPRCSLKIDLHKAFDSLHWDFISFIIKALHLPPRFITWIETCFTQARYSISFNGSLIGYFKGARGDDLMIFCKGNVDSIMGVLSISGFIKGSLPVRYLSIPLVTCKLTEKDYVVLIDKIKQRLHHWSARNLSYAGKLELIRSVLFNVSNIWCRQLILPNLILAKVDQLCSGFFWKCKDKSAAGARVSWDFICFSKAEGGLGLKNTKIWNIACTIDLIRKILAGDGSLWVAWLNSYVFKDQDLWNFVAGSNVSWSVNRILKLRSTLLSIFSSSCSLRLRDIWESIRIKRGKVPWQNLIWFPMRIPKFSLITWISLLNRLPTRDRLLKIGISTEGTCVNCSNDQEIRNHLFCQYTLAVRLWSSVLSLNGLKNTSSTWEEMVTRASSTWKGKSLLITILKISWTTYIYALSEERNRRIFQGRHRSTDELLKVIIEAVQIQLKGKNINRADRTNSNLCIAWGIT